MSASAWLSASFRQSRVLLHPVTVSNSDIIPKAKSLDFIMIPKLTNLYNYDSL
jgi:hypothetical protein